MLCEAQIPAEDGRGCNGVDAGDCSASAGCWALAALCLMTQAPPECSAMSFTLLCTHFFTTLRSGCASVNACNPIKHHESNVVHRVPVNFWSQWVM